VVRGTTIILFCLDPDGLATWKSCMPFLQEQKTVTDADLFRHLELENTDAILVLTNSRYIQHVFIVFSNELFSFACLTGDC